MNREKIVVATRRSALALAQARAWMRHFTEVTGIATEELHVVTTGDRVQDRALNEIGGKGLFVKEIEEAMLEGRADCAVHSLKDVPAELAPELKLGCFPKREDPRDVITTRSGSSFEQLPSGAKVGTSSLRRMTQLKLKRSDLDYVPIRGNVDTRLRKCEEGEVDAVVLALAGLKRLGFEDRYTHALEPEVSLPAIGQGALAIELRSSDSELSAELNKLTDSDTERAVSAERGVMLAVEGGCQMPVAGFALRSENELWLRAMLAESDGSNLRYESYRGLWPTSAEAAFEIGLAVGRKLKRT